MRVDPDRVYSSFIRKNRRIERVKVWIAKKEKKKRKEKQGKKATDDDRCSLYTVGI